MKLIKKKLLIVIIICAVLVGGSVIWFTRQTVEAAILNPHPGLVGWWRFDEGSGTVAGDSSGNGNNGTISGATWGAGKYGQALSFDGVNNYVDFGDPEVLRLGTTNFTITAWVNYTSEGWAIVSKGNGAHNDGYGYAIFIADGGSVYIKINNGAGAPATVVSNPIPTGVWTHVAVVMARDTNGQIYINGQASGAAVSISSKTDITSTDPFYVGRYITAMDFSGIMDEVRIYSQALTVADIGALFQKGPDFSSNLAVKVPKGTTQVITTLSWQGAGSINATIVVSLSENYTEDEIPVYQKIVYSTSGGPSGMLNIKRLSVTVTALSSDENWYVVLTFDNVDDYKITVEVQK